MALSRSTPGTSPRRPATGGGKDASPPGVADADRRGVAYADAAHLAAIVESSFDAIISVDLDRRITCWNPSAERMYGWTAGEMLGRDILDVVPPERRREFGWQLDLVRDGVRPPESETTRQTAAGGRIDVAVMLSPIRDAAGSVVAVSLIERDIFERGQLLAQLEHLALHDTLTGLLNRRGLEGALATAIARSERREDEVALLIVDIDHFKDINDTLGHKAGDVLIRDVAVRLDAAARAGDVVARLGGDEFAIVLTGADLAAATLAAERFRAAIAQAPERAQVITASIGVAAHERGMTGDELLVRADLAMYAVKAGGRDGVRCAPPGRRS